MVACFGLALLPRYLLHFCQQIPELAVVHLHAVIQIQANALVVRFLAALRAVR